MTALHRPRYYYGVLSMHNQKRNKIFYQQKQGYPHDYRHTLHPSILGGHDSETSFAPRVYPGAAFKGLLPYTSGPTSLLPFNASKLPSTPPQYCHSTHSHCRLTSFSLYLAPLGHLLAPGPPFNASPLLVFIAYTLKSYMTLKLTF